MDYLADLKKLPDYIQDILISPFGANLNREIGEKYFLNDEQIEAMIDLTNEVYLGILKIDSLSDAISSRLKIDPKKSASLAIELAGKKLLISDDYFKGKISAFLKEKAVNLADFSEIIAKQKEALNEEIEKIEPQENQEAFQDILTDPLSNEDFFKQSQEDTLNLFREDLVKILSLGSEFNDLVDELNDDIFEFIEDNNYRQKLESALYNNNQENVTRIKPIINNNPERGTIANWLKDFIAFHGSDNFSDIVLAEYLVNSANAKKLSANDKKKIKKLLKIYRNLVFFPDSFKDKGPDWGVIPLEIDYSKTEGKKETKPSDIMKSDKEGRSKSIPIRKGVIEDSEMKNNKTLEPAKITLLDELQIMLKDYPENSLEYKAIEQEIKHLSSKINKK